ncbi:MAG TPA: hypothetical protein VHT50_08700 [Mycobacterium sp.]|nr:hypothetical protein [Mycobacterium sp.]
MSDVPGEQLDEEPQNERGAPGSRDTGSDEPSGGPTDRPTGGSDERSDTSVAPQQSDGDAPNLQTP